MRSFEREWEEKYCFELRAERRKKLLDEAISTWGMCPENELRLALFEARYGKSKEQQVDFFIRGWMALRFIGANNKSFFGKKRNKKEMESVVHDWKISLARSYGEIGDKVLYQEFCNLTLVYLKLCREDTHYNSLLLGLGRMKENDLTSKIAKDIYNAAFEIPQEQGAFEELALFREAAVDMFYREFPEAEIKFNESASGF